MAGIRISGRVVYKQLGGLLPEPVRGARVRVIDVDRGGNGDDEIFVATTDADGNFGGTSREWSDRNTEAQRIWVPTTVVGFPPRRVDAHWENVTVDVPDALLLRVRVDYDGKSETYDYAQVPGRSVVVVEGPAPEFKLPKDEVNPTVRNARTAAERLAYPWEKLATAPLPHVKSSGGYHPPQELPTHDYVERRSRVEGRIQENSSRVKLHQVGDPLDTPQDFQDLFQVLPQPPGPSPISDDAEFVRQRVSGVNPLVIRKMTAVPEALNLPLSHRLEDGSTVQQALAAGLLFVCDYAELDGIAAVPGRFFAAPFAVFLARPGASGRPAELVPVGIQVERGAGVESERRQFITPGAALWRVAKTYVQMVDLNLHEVKSHLFETHLAMEPLAVAAARQLAANHPIRELLRVHFRFMLHQNVAARNLLVNSGGKVDTLLGTGIAGARTLAQRARSAWTFEGASLRNSLERRGILASPRAQFNYPYRDDALLVWDALQKHVERWVQRFYRNDAEVRDDPELQAWRREAMDPQLGDLGPLPTLDSMQALAAMLTQVVFTCTAQHSCVNYPQFRFMAMVPNMPASLRVDWKGKATDPFSLLPRGELALGQVELSAELSLYQHDRLGAYPVYQDAPLRQLVSRFQAELGELEARINTNNTERGTQYTALLPRAISNSISI